MPTESSEVSRSACVTLNGSIGQTGLGLKKIYSVLVKTCVVPLSEYIGFRVSSSTSVNLDESVSFI